MPENNKDFQRFDYRIDNVNDQIDYTNGRMDSSFQQLTNELRQSNQDLSRQISNLSNRTSDQINKLSVTNKWAIGTIITIIVAVIIDAIEISITLIY